MPQKYLTLEEAAEQLGLSPADLKARLRNEWKGENVRTFQDGGTLRIGAEDVEKLGRLMGHGSEPELQLGDPADGVDDLDLSLDLDDPAPPETQIADPADEPLLLGDDSETFAIVSDEPASKGSDSDVRLEKKVDPESDHPSEQSSTEEIDFRLPEAGDPEAVVPDPTPAAPEEDDSSEFELSLEDSDSDFALDIAEDDGSDEVPLGERPSAKRAGDSGINLGKPDDSGISLESKADDDDEEIDFELTLDSSSSMSKISSKSGKKKRPAPEPSDEDSSEFELSIDDLGDMPEGTVALEGQPAEEAEEGNDIFETDFDIPALDDDSASEAIELDEADTDLEEMSDVDLALDVDDLTADDDSASDVMLLDDEEPMPSGRRRASSAFDDDMSASAALEGVSADDDYDYDEEYDEDGAPVARDLPTKPWGAFPALMLIPCVLVLFVAGLMSYELLHGMWGYQTPEDPTSPVVDGVAGLFDAKPKQ